MVSEAACDEREEKEMQLQPVVPHSKHNLTLRSLTFDSYLFCT